MFGLSKRERAEKQLHSALRLYLPGDPGAHASILAHNEEDTKTAVAAIVADVTPYEAGAMLIAAFIRHGLEQSSDVAKQRILRLVSDGSTSTPPDRFQSSIHMVQALIKLELGGKPLVPDGTTAKFLDSVAAAFSPQQGVKNKIASYIYKSAVEAMEPESSK
jgi:hypothetical protein